MKEEELLNRAWGELYACRGEYKLPSELPLVSDDPNILRCLRLLFTQGYADEQTGRSIGKNQLNEAYYCISSRGALISESLDNDFLGRPYSFILKKEKEKQRRKKIFRRLFRINIGSTIFLGLITAFVQISTWASNSSPNNKQQELITQVQKIITTDSLHIMQLEKLHLQNQAWIDSLLYSKKR